MRILDFITLSRPFGACLNLAVKFSKAAGWFSMETLPIEITAYQHRSERWPYEPLKIVVASDFHVGCPSVTLKDLEEIVLRINALEPDIVLLPGDFVTDNNRFNGEFIDPNQIAAVLKGLEAPGGVYAVSGNHDCFEERQSEMHAALERENIRVLYNAAQLIEYKNMQFWITGTGDLGTKKADLAETFLKVTDNLPIISMMHNPGTVNEMKKTDSTNHIKPVIVVSGHTHGGQYNFKWLGRLDGFLKGILLNCPDTDLFYGMNERDGIPVCTSSGLGTSSYPMRNVPPEIVLLTLMPA